MITYGYSVKENDDPYMEIVEASVDGFSETLRPGRRVFLVDTIPSRKWCSLRTHTPGDANYNCLSVIRDVSSSLTVFVVLSGFGIAPSSFTACSFSTLSVRVESVNSPALRLTNSGWNSPSSSYSPPRVDYQVGRSCRSLEEALDQIPRT